MRLVLTLNMEQTKLVRLNNTKEMLFFPIAHSLELRADQRENEIWPGKSTFNH